MTFNRMQGFSSIENKQRQKKNEIMLWLHNQTSRLSGPFKNEHLLPVNNTLVCKYWKILFYPSNTDTWTFYGGYTDIDTDSQYPKYSTD